MDHLDALEAESVYVLREAFAKLDNLAILWSLGKDSNVGPRYRLQDRSTPSDADRPSSYTALTRHRLGVIAQTLEHWEAAERCSAEALRIAVELDEHLLCAQSYHQLSEIRQAEGRLALPGWPRPTALIW